MTATNSHLAAALAARDVLESSTSGSINTTTVLLIVFVAIVPVLITAGAIIWLLAYYGRGRGCCARRNKTTKNKEKPASQTPRENSVQHPPSRNPRKQKSVVRRPEPSASGPVRPKPAHTRNASSMSGKSAGSSWSKRTGSSNEQVPTLPAGFV